MKLLCYQGLKRDAGLGEALAVGRLQRFVALSRDKSAIPQGCGVSLAVFASVFRRDSLRVLDGLILYRYRRLNRDRSKTRVC